MTGDASRFGLYGLCTTNLQPVGCGVGVQRHILCLEWGRVVAVLFEDATEGCSNDAFANIATSTGKHDGVESLHILYKCV